MLPYEEEVVAGVRRELGVQLAYAEEMLRDALVVAVPPFMPRRKKLHPIVKDMALGLHVRVCRKFRQALLLVPIGQADGIEILCRSMFEATLAQIFICRSRVRLRHIGGTPVNLHGETLSQTFRARLYAAHTFTRDEKRYAGMATKAGLK